mgnify:CR=1 FL=1
MLIRILIFIAFFFNSNLNAQDESCIGLTKEEVKKVMKEQYRSFAPDNTVTKQHFNYLKYANNSETMTWIIYFSDDDICTSTKKVCDYIEYDYVLKELNEKYTLVKEGTWEYQSGKKRFVITIEEKDWYFSVGEREKVKSMK